MDERLKKALDYSNYMVSLNAQKRILLENFQNDSLYFFNGGEFLADNSLISFVQSLIQLNQTEAVLLDKNNLPILVENLDTFQKNVLDTYAKASNRYFAEYNKLKNTRKIEILVEV